MIKVYFESDSHAECVATFRTEAMYMACIETLKAEATKQGMIVTESEVDESVLLSHVRESIDGAELWMTIVGDMPQVKSELTKQLESLRIIEDILQ
jgi:hypothetical protein